MNSLTYKPLLPNSGPQVSGTEKIEASDTRLKCLLKCSYSLSEEEAQVLSYLIIRGRGDIPKNIAKAVNRNPEVVRRALRELYKRGLVSRRPYPLRRGGRAFLYEASNGIIDVVISTCLGLGETLKNLQKQLDYRPLFG